MGDNAVGGAARGRKRKRQVSWAAAELLEEVKVFHMAKPVNPSFPPPAVDDGGEGDANGEDAASQSGTAFLGVPSVEVSSGSASATIASANTKHPAALAGTSSACIPSDPSSDVHPALISGSGEGGSGGSGSGPGGVGGVDGIGGLGGRGGGISGSTSTSTSTSTSSSSSSSSSSSLFRGFQKTETVIRRKKQAPPPPPPPGTPPSPPSPGEGAHTMLRYPKDIWPGHVPTNHADNNGLAAIAAVAVGAPTPVTGGAGAATEPGELLEFFCDVCDETIPTGTERMECAVCPDEFCLCVRCYDEAEILDKRHEHELLSSKAPFHVTRAASSAEAAAAAAAALHKTEAIFQEAYDDDLG